MGELSQNYEKVSRIGSGAYGEVWKARDMYNPEVMVALKRIRSPTDEEGVSTSLVREVAYLIDLNRHNNDHIVKLLDVCPGNHDIRGMELYLVFEHIEQDLATFLMNAPPGGLSLSQIKSIMHQLLDGIKFIHESRIEHRDLKPQNVLITDSGLVKIADFGLARLYKPNAVQTSVVATLWYRSPEVLLSFREGYASAVDMWGAGCIFGEIVRREPLFQGTSENSQLVKIFEIIGSPNACDWPRGTSLAYASFAGYSEVSFRELFPQMPFEAIDLIKRMLTFNPERRISAKGALAHPYFQNYTPVLIPAPKPQPQPQQPQPQPQHVNHRANRMNAHQFPNNTPATSSDPRPPVFELVADPMDQINHRMLHNQNYNTEHPVMQPQHQPQQQPQQQRSNGSHNANQPEQHSDQHIPQQQHLNQNGNTASSSLNSNQNNSNNLLDSNDTNNTLPNFAQSNHAPLDFINLFDSDPVTTGHLVESNHHYNSREPLHTPQISHQNLPQHLHLNSQQTQSPLPQQPQQRHPPQLPHYNSNNNHLHHLHQQNHV